MRGVRRATLVSLLIMLGLGLAGCARRPAGTDGDLTNNWAAMAKPVTPIPSVGVCYARPLQEIWYGAFDTIACDQSHHTETVYVGTFTGDDAKRSTAPRATSPKRKATYGKCQQALNDYLGGDWHSAPIWLGLVLPSDAAWSGGARWFRCDVTVFTDLTGDTELDKGSVRDGLRGKRPLAITCFIGKDGKDDSVTIDRGVDCAQPHNGEFAGVFTPADSAYPADADRRSKLGQDGCEKVVAKYLGFSGGRDRSPYIGWMWTDVDEDRWNIGDRAISCYAYISGGKKATGSAKGVKDHRP